MNWEQTIWRVLLALLHAIPQLAKRIRQYFVFSVNTYKKQRQKTDNMRKVIRINKKGKRQKWVEFICKLIHYTYPILVLITLCFIVPAIVVAVLWWITVKAVQYIIIGVLITGAILSWREPQKQVPPLSTIPPLDYVFVILNTWAYQVTLYLKDVLPSPIRMPTSESETRGSPSIVSIGGVKRLQFYIPLHVDKQDMEIDVNDTKELLQRGFNNLLSDGELPEQPYMSSNVGADIPILEVDGEHIITVADIKREKLRLVVTAFWVNNSQMAAIVKRWRGKISESKNGSEGGIDGTDRNY